MGTATWFLTSLFIILVVHCTIVFFNNKFFGVSERVLWLSVFLLMAFVSQLISVFRPNLQYAIRCFPCTYLVFLMGNGIKKYQNKKIHYSLWSGLVSSIILFFISYFKLIDIEVSSAKIGNVIGYMFVSVLGWNMLMSLALLIKKNITMTLIIQYLGKHSMTIMCLHILAFKVVSWLYILIYRKPWVLLAGFHIIFDANWFWKFIYLVMGVALPIGAHWCYCKIRQRCFYR